MRRGQSVTQVVEEPSTKKTRSGDRVHKKNYMDNKIFLLIEIARAKWDLSFPFMEAGRDSDKAHDEDRLGYNLITYLKPRGSRVVIGPKAGQVIPQRETFVRKASHPSFCRHMRGL